MVNVTSLKSQYEAAALIFDSNSSNKKLFDDVNLTTRSKPVNNLEELTRYLIINLICIVSLMIMMSFCYMSHVFYNNIWKPWRM
jgi:hypothetical protein